MSTNLKRHITVLTLMIMLVLAACSPTAAPVAEDQPAVAPPTESTAAAEEPTEEATAVTEDVTQEATEEATDEATDEATAEVAEEPTAQATEAITDTSIVTDTAAVTETAALEGCPEPDADTQLVSSAAAGYCFLIPAGFERSEFSDAEGFNIGIYGPESTPGHRERALINVTAAGGVNAEAGVQLIVDEVIASMADFTITQESLTLGGVDAIRVDGLPGQDANIKIYALNLGRLYELTFVPADESQADAYAEMEELYTHVVESFHFMEPTDAASSYAPLLNWEGEIDGACYTLAIEPSGQATVAVCGDEPSATSTFADDHVEWVAVQEHFGSINAETSAGTINFIGQGNAQSNAWAEALATWARFTAMEINAGRAGASNRTTLAWQLTTQPEHSGLCSQVIVLAYGYAYANQIPCDGNGQATTVATGWLSDAELDTFQTWVNEGARVESETGYLDAQGETPVTPDEVTNWANAVYTRLLQ